MTFWAGPVAIGQRLPNDSPMSTPRVPHAHLVQLDIAWEDKPANYARVRSLLARAEVCAGDLVVLPELFDTGFSFNLGRTVDADGATLRFIAALASELRATIHGSRTVLGPDNRGRNRASIAGPDGGIICEYDKVHPFTFGKEAEHFSGGERVETYSWMPEGPASVAAPAVVCPAICYDLRFPELFRIGLLKGAEVFALGANWPAPRKLHRSALSIARAIENQAFVLSVNRAGRDPTLIYAGGTMAVSPRGEVIGELDEREGVLSVPVDVASVREWRAAFPAWKDHRLIGRTE